MTRDLKDSALYESRYGLRERRANLRFIVLLLMIVALFLGGRVYWINHYGGVQVYGPSMQNTLQSGEQLIIEYTGEKNKAKRGDIIVVQVDGYAEVKKENEGLPASQQLKFVIKRLIAVEGDVVRCEDGRVEIKYAGEEDFQPLDEPYAYYPSDRAKEEYDFAEYKVGRGEVFFLGDNRTNSKDSRYKEKNGSNLKDRLYEEKDIIGFVPEWALKYQSILQKIFF